MKPQTHAIAAASVSLSLLLGVAIPAVAAPPGEPSVSTLVKTPLTIEGLTNDAAGNLYAPGRTPPASPGVPCPVYLSAADNPDPVVVVGFVPASSPTAQCSPSGLAFGPDGLLYVTETDRIYRLAPDAASPPFATLFASGVPGTNGLAFDRAGTLWTGDGTTGQGRVWQVAPDGSVSLAFHVPAMVNSIGVGRDVRTNPPATSQPLVANGLAFDANGDLFIADTARGALWKVPFKNGKPAAPTGCDAAYAPDTLCFDNVHVAHPALEGTDGIVLDVAGNIWTVANERNAIVVVTTQGEVREVFRNPPDGALLRNGGPLESPASPVIAGHRFCTSNSDGNRRDNSPNTAGEIKPAGPWRGKIACLDQRLNVPGMALPVR